MAEKKSSSLAGNIKNFSRGIIRAIPVGIRYKQRLKCYLFQSFPKIFSGFDSYSDWALDYAPIDYAALGAKVRAGSGSPASIRDPSSEKRLPRLIMVTHDAKPHGAQFLALGMVKMLTQEMNVEVEVVILGGGRLRSEFGRAACVHEFSEFKKNTVELTLLSQDFVRRGFRKAIVNTVASGRIVPIFRAAGIDSVCLVHELPGIIRRFGLERQAEQIAANAMKVVFPAKVVADGFRQFANVSDANQVIRAQGLYRRNRWRSAKEAARSELRSRLNLPKDSKVVLTVGFADHRKGADLFVACAINVMNVLDDVEFVWVGHWDQTMHFQMLKRLSETPIKERVHFVGYDPDTSLYHAASDLYLLTSREDPFPNVVLESFDVAVPVVAFASTGGAAEFVEEVNNVVVPYEDVHALSTEVIRLLKSRETSLNMGRLGQERVDRQFSFRDYMQEISGLLFAESR